jgi:hypothetical protein
MKNKRNKKVRNIHFVGDPEKEVFNKVIMNLSTHALTMSSGESFEKL